MNEADFRSYLQKELSERCKRNENYSLRSFARFLGVPASSLSLIMNGSRPVTQKSKMRIGLALGLKISDLIEPHEDRKVRIEDYQRIQLQQFEVVSDWYHFAILELTKVNDFCPDLKWIAQALGISLHQAHRAVSNLVKLGYLDTSTKRWRDLTINGFATNITPGMTSEAAREMQRQILDQSRKALETVPLEERDHTSLTVAISKTKIKKVREKIKDFRRELDAMIAADDEFDEVYQVSIGFFPITKRRTTR